MSVVAPGDLGSSNMLLEPHRLFIRRVICQPLYKILVGVWPLVPVYKALYRENLKMSGNQKWSDRSVLFTAKDGSFSLKGPFAPVEWAQDRVNGLPSNSDAPKGTLDEVTTAQGTFRTVSATEAVRLIRKGTRSHPVGFAYMANEHAIFAVLDGNAIKKISTVKPLHQELRFLSPLINQMPEIPADERATLFTRPEPKAQPEAAKAQPAEVSETQVPVVPEASGEAVKEAVELPVAGVDDVDSATQKISELKGVGKKDKTKKSDKKS